MENDGYANVETRHRGAYLTMLFSSIASLIASLVLSTDSITLARNANAKLSCDINALISCGKVAVSWQSNLLGFPNAFLGLICEAVVITVAVAGLGGVVFPRMFMKVALAVYGVGCLFALWLFSQSYFVIHAFCPWCLLVTFSTVGVFASMARINLLDNVFEFSEEKMARVADLLNKRYDLLVACGIYTVLAVAVIIRYHAAFLP